MWHLKMAESLVELSHCNAIYECNQRFYWYGTFKTIEGFGQKGGIEVREKNFSSDHRDLGDHRDRS